MKFYLLSLFTVVLLFSGCSQTRQEFIIANQTDSDLIVQYSYYDKARIIYKPRVAPSDKIDDPGKKWREIPSKFFDVDGDTRMVSVKIDPNQALLIVTEDNFDPKKTEEFPINLISFVGSKGNRLYQEKDVLRSFTKEENGNYVIYYK